MVETNFNESILTNMPHFIAVNYQKLLKAQTSQEQVKLTLHIYNLGLRALTIGLVSQYLIKDRDRVSDSYLNELLLQKFPHLTLDAWQQLLFAALRAYEGNQDLFFMSEIYDFYWDTSTLPHKRKTDIEQPFERLTQIAIELQTKRLLPQDEGEWNRLAEETMGFLRQILSSVAFLEKYDLIRVLDYDDLFYDFELHKGLKISLGRQHLPKRVEPSRGWFYLRKDTKEFLLLHPFLVFWEDEPDERGLVATDTGVYDRFIYERLQYLLTTLGKTIVDTNSVQAFVTLLYDTIEETKRNRQKADKLTWWQLRDICADITRQRMATVRHKYRPELYLQRDKTRQAFEQFLNSEKRCFVLIGKSGVGKSNFSLALSEELQHSHSDICILMYDGAHLKVEPSVTEAISRDLDNRLILAGRRITEVWYEIAQVDGINERQVILYVDAINENPQAKELLKQLDELVQTPWPWLKIVFSSRPETWQVIKRGVRLAEALYYREEGSEALGVELEPFSYSEQMEPFSRQELPEAYTKYQQVFNLQTEYKILPSRLREILRDPLSLWLVAKTYQGQPIPYTLKAIELIEQYVNALLRSERLQVEDLRLLEKQLVPLMVREGCYSNAITIADIDAVGGGLYETMYSEQILSNGRQMNQSFINLLDTEILVKQGEGREQKIAFKYERFYEFFVGKHIFELSKTQADRPTFFKNMVSQTNTTPFFWGAVKNALIQEMKECGPETLMILCFTDQQRVKEMMVNVYIDFGRDNPIEIEKILKYLLPPKKRMGRLQSIRQLLGKIDVSTDIHTRNARKIAIETASNMNISWVLQMGAIQADPTIRTVAVRYTYYLWQRHPDTVFEILEYLAQIAIPGLLPNFAALESVLGLSLIILVDHSQDELTLKRLQEIWQRIISKVFGIRRRMNRFESGTREFIRERIVSLVITVIFQLLREFPDYNIVSYSALEAFFQLSDTKKELYKNLTQYIDPQGDYPKEKMENDLLAAITVRDLLIESVIMMILVAHVAHAPTKFLPFLKRFFEETKKSSIPNPYPSIVSLVSLTILDHDPFRDEFFNFFVNTIEECQKYYVRNLWRPALRTTEAPQAMYLGPYMLCQYQRTGNIKTEWLRARIDSALEHKDSAFFASLIKSHLPFAGIEFGKPQIALDALALFFDRCDSEHERMIQSFLARLRIYYPDEVDNFLEEQKTSEEFRLEIRTAEPNETLGELIGLRSCPRISFHFEV